MSRGYSIQLGKQNIPLVEELFNINLKQEIVPNLLDSLNRFQPNVKDLAVLLKCDVNYKIKKNELLETQQDYANAFEIFDHITNQIFRKQVNKALSIKQLIPIILDLMRIPNLYGIVGKDLTTNEIINFTHPFRAISLLKDTTRVFSIDNLYIYKLPTNKIISQRLVNKELINMYVKLYCSLYMRGLNIKDNYEQSTTYIRFVEKTKNVQIFKKINKEQTKRVYNSYLYYSDILVNNTFCPHYSIFKLNVTDTRLVGTFLKNVACLMPNISESGSVCTGNNRNLSNEGIIGLRISNMLSPYIKRVYHYGTLLTYTKCCLEQTMQIYKGSINES